LICGRKCRDNGRPEDAFMRQEILRRQTVVGTLPASEAFPPMNPACA
jgi:hypothetical protein